MFDVIVIGGGPAGVTAALRANELGASVALIERGRMGGSCTNDTCVPTRIFARAARLLRDAESYADYGLLGERPSLDFSKLLEQTHDIVAKLHAKKRLVEHLMASGVTVHAEAGEARFLDRHTIELGSGGRLQGKAFILCAGGKARRLSFPGAEHALTHSDVWKLTSLPKAVAIIGAAATGCQLASIFAAFGSDVYLLDVAPRILPSEDESVSHALSEAMGKRGVQVITSMDGVECIERHAEKLVVHYTHAGKMHTLEVEAVIMAAGWTGNVDSLNLSAAGVYAERGYVLVNDQLRTSSPRIFAAGDITGRMMLVQSANHEAYVAAENAVLEMNQRYCHTVAPHGGFTDPEYGSVGLTEVQARTEHGEVGYVSATVPYANLDRALIDGHTEGFCKLIVSTETHRILGVHVVGEQAVEVVQLVAAGITTGMRVESLAELELAYPTYTAILGLAARQLVRRLGVTPLAAKQRALLGMHAAEWERGENEREPLHER